MKLPKAKEGCPPLFQMWQPTYPGSAVVVAEPDNVLLGQGTTSSEIKEDYCVKDATSGGLGKMDHGSYCTEKVEGVACPTGMFIT